MLDVVRKDDSYMERHGLQSRERQIRQQEYVFIKNIEVAEKLPSKTKITLHDRDGILNNPKHALFNQKKTKFMNQMQDSGY